MHSTTDPSPQDHVGSLSKFKKKPSKLLQPPPNGELRHSAKRRPKNVGSWPCLCAFGGESQNPVSQPSLGVLGADTHNAVRGSAQRQPDTEVGGVAGTCVEASSSRDSARPAAWSEDPGLRPRLGDASGEGARCRLPCRGGGLVSSSPSAQAGGGGQGLQARGFF